MQPKLYISVSSSPGTLGSRVYNTLFQRRGMNALYLPRKAPSTPDALTVACRALGVAGCSVSMPLKTAIIPYLDFVDETARAIYSVNTIVNKDGELQGYCTDYCGVKEALESAPLKKRPTSALVYGAGGVVGSVVQGLRDFGVSRIALTGRDVYKVNHRAALLGVEVLDETVSKNFDLLVNATPASVDPSSRQLFALMDKVDAVFDLVPRENGTYLLDEARKRSLDTVTGLSMFCAQVRHQFRLYTGEFPSKDEVLEALVPPLQLAETT